LPDPCGLQFLPFCRLRSSPVQPDFVCRYEELKAEAPAVLTRLAEALDHPVGPDAATQSARAHDASLMRRGAIPRKGNLHPTGSRGWREEASESQRLILHSFLTEVVTSAEYPADDCLGRRIEMRARPGRRRVSFPDIAGLGALFARNRRGRDAGAWMRVGEARGPMTVPSEAELKLRVHDSASHEAISCLSTLPATSLDSLCLAGNPKVDDDQLRDVLGSLKGIHELDLARQNTNER